MTRKYANIYERLVAHTKECPVTGCWLWTGTVNDRGRPKLTIRKPGRKSPVGVVPGRLMIEATQEWHFPFDEVGHFHCFNPLCVRPDHIRIETAAENTATRRVFTPTGQDTRRWIPVLFPTASRLMQEAADWAFDTPGVAGSECPW